MSEIDEEALDMSVENVEENDKLLEALENEQETAAIKRQALTYRQEKFCQEYLVDLNATQSAIRAGYSATSSKSVRSLGSHLKRGLAWRIEELMAERNIRCEVDSDWVLKELVGVTKKCQEFEPVLDFKGKQVTRETDDGRLVAVYQFNAKGATGALDLIGKHIGMFKEKIEITVDEGFADVMKAARERVMKANAEKTDD